MLFNNGNNNKVRKYAELDNSNETDLYAKRYQLFLGKSYNMIISRKQ